MDSPKKRTSSDDEGRAGEEPVMVVPKKRGRPASTKVAQKPVAGRGRGRPSKDARPRLSVPSKHVPVESDDDEEDDGSDSGASIENVANGDASPVAPSPAAAATPSQGRGRPPKAAKSKISQPIESTGRGRGRPKNATKPNYVERDATDDEVEKVVPKKSKAGRPAKKKAGRPRKNPSDDEDDTGSEKNADDDSRGRPSTGGVNLNIERTGRGQGRPKKLKESENGAAVAEVATPKKRGRPPTGKASKPFVPSGKPRGRPKANAAVARVNDPESPDEGDDGSSSDSMPTPKADTKKKSDDNSCIMVDDEYDDVAADGERLDHSTGGAEMTP